MALALKFEAPRVERAARDSDHRVAERVAV
jgi:hypothetical protein